MKKSIFTLAFAVVAFTNVTLAGTTDQSNENGPSSNVSFIASVSDTAVSRPVSLIGANYERSIEEIIAEESKITESVIPDATPICTRMTLEETIAEDNKIIDSNMTKEVYPLDFKRIDMDADFTKIRNNGQAVLFDN